MVSKLRYLNREVGWGLRFALGIQLAEAMASIVRNVS